MNCDTCGSDRHPTQECQTQIKTATIETTTNAHIPAKQQNKNSKPTNICIANTKKSERRHQQKGYAECTVDKNFTEPIEPSFVKSSFVKMIFNIIKSPHVSTATET